MKITLYFFGIAAASILLLWIAVLCSTAVKGTVTALLAMGTGLILIALLLLAKALAPSIRRIHQILSPEESDD